MNVRARAMLRRTCFIFSVLVSCCVAFCILSPNCSFSRASNSVFSSAADRAAKSFLIWVFFITGPRSADQPMDERRPDRQLGGRQRKRRAGHDFVHAVHLVEHL